MIFIVYYCSKQRLLGLSFKMKTKTRGFFKCDNKSGCKMKGLFFCFSSDNGALEQNFPITYVYALGENVRHSQKNKSKLFLKF